MYEDARKPILLIKIIYLPLWFLLLTNPYSKPIIRWLIDLIYNSWASNSIVVEGRYSIEGGRHGHFLLLGKWIKPHMSDINLILLISIGEVLLEQCLNFIVSIEFIIIRERGYFTLGRDPWIFVIDQDLIWKPSLSSILFSINSI